MFLLVALQELTDLENLAIVNPPSFRFPTTNH